jgi:hypothetical protein
MLFKADSIPILEGNRNDIFSDWTSLLPTTYPDEWNEEDSEDGR